LTASSITMIEGRISMRARHGLKATSKGDEINE
jgi:hypothetical protein